MPLYFAYGANMDREAMARRCPSSRPLGLARLPRHRWIISTDGYANVLRDPRREVVGLLWELALSDVPALDRFEDVPRLYRKVTQPVISAAGIRRALVYLGRSVEPGRPRAGYLEDVLRAGRRRGCRKAASTTCGASAGPSRLGRSAGHPIRRPPRRVPPRRNGNGRPDQPGGERRTTPSRMKTSNGVVPDALPSLARQRPAVQSTPPWVGTASKLIVFS